MTDIEACSPLKILKDAKARIENTDNWTQNAFATKPGPAFPVMTHWSDPEADCWCASGSILKSVNELSGLEHGSIPFYQLGHKVERFLRGELLEVNSENKYDKGTIDDPINKVSQVNDYWGHDAVMEMFTRTIDKLESSD